ncbi:MAG: hypothetical protein AB7N91_17990 [Candidatus Tectimicrobiota bacterium]
MQTVIAICRHLPSRYIEHTAPALQARRHRIVMALEPDKSRLEHALVQASLVQEQWDLTVLPGEARVEHMQRTHREVLRRYVCPDYIACLTSTWVRAANTAALSRQALAPDYVISNVLPCRVLDPSPYRDLSRDPAYIAFHAAHVRQHGVAPSDPTLLPPTLPAGGSVYQTWLNGKAFVDRLLAAPGRVLQRWGHHLPPQTATLLVMAYSHKEVWGQIVADAYSEQEGVLDASLNPGELLLLVPEGPEQVRLHLPESQLPTAVLPRQYFAGSMLEQESVTL